MKLPLYFIIIAFITGCNNRNSDTPKSVTPDSQFESVSHSVKKIKGPTTELLDFVNRIEKSNWVPDTLRQQEKNLYKYLGQIELYDNRPFYEIDFENTELKQMFKLKPESFLKKDPEFDINLFSDVMSIYGYYYREADDSNFISDGVIEQWEFENSNKAVKALNHFKKNGQFIYFNTTPYFCRIDKHLFVFRTRAMAFSSDQKKVFEMFR